MHSLDQEKIRDRAYQLWIEAGSPEGRDQEFWFDAERELAGQDEVDTSEFSAQVEQPPMVPGGLH